jgi:alkylhydroperoxidase/carboxymuconolactone decarboxylase family protein YurZ
MPIPNISVILPMPKLKALRDAYSRTDATAFLSSVLPSVYDKSEDYNRAISAAFYGNLPSDDPSESRKELSHADRERCLVALLTSRGVPDNLAAHIYLALMEKISVEEVAHVMMLAGMYSGVDRFTTALAAYITTLTTLAALVDGKQPLGAPAVLGQLRLAFNPVAQLEMLKTKIAETDRGPQTSNSSRTGTLVPQ